MDRPHRTEPRTLRLVHRTVPRHGRRRRRPRRRSPPRRHHGTTPRTHPRCRLRPRTCRRTTRHTRPPRRGSRHRPDPHRRRTTRPSRRDLARRRPLRTRPPRRRHHRRIRHRRLRRQRPHIPRPRHPERPVLARLREHLNDSGRIVAGFGANRDYAFDDFLDDAHHVGLAPELLVSTWDLRPLLATSDFLVAVLSHPHRALNNRSSGLPGQAGSSQISNGHDQAREDTCEARVTAWGSSPSTERCQLERPS